ncbi:hypothetical protein V8E55_010678 [Tylopilus felleus]
MVPRSVRFAWKSHILCVNWVLYSAMPIFHCVATFGRYLRRSGARSVGGQSKTKKFGVPAFKLCRSSTFEEVCSVQAWVQTLAIPSGGRPGPSGYHGVRVTIKVTCACHARVSCSTVTLWQGNHLRLFVLSLDRVLLYLLLSGAATLEECFNQPVGTTQAAACRWYTVELQKGCHDAALHSTGMRRVNSTI